jgi:hypothetical protein
MHALNKTSRTFHAPGGALQVFFFKITHVRNPHVARAEGERVSRMWAVASRSTGSG